MIQRLCENCGEPLEEHRPLTTKYCLRDFCNKAVQRKQRKRLIKKNQKSYFVWFDQINADLIEIKALNDIDARKKATIIWKNTNYIHIEDVREKKSDLKRTSDKEGV